MPYESAWSAPRPVTRLPERDNNDLTVPPAVVSAAAAAPVNNAPSAVAVAALRALLSLMAKAGIVANAKAMAAMATIRNNVIFFKSQSEQ